MHLGFWGKLKKPFTVMAPMANVTDFAFRQIMAKCRRPDVFYTEFISCDGIVAAGKDKFYGELYHEKSESPIVVQFFGSNSENFYKCAQLASELGFDGIDINMGCPDRSVEKQGAGAALIKNPKLAQEIIIAAQEGASGLPVSVKTRLGYNQVQIEEWIPQLLETKPAALIIHGRTRKEMSKTAANWQAIGRVKEIAQSMSPETLIVGNGDVKDLNDAYQKAREHNLDGIMTGRAVFENPYFFNSDVSWKELHPIEKIKLAAEHLDNFEKLWGRNKRFDYMKKFFKMYIFGWQGAKELRSKLMDTRNRQEAKSIVDDYLLKV